MTGSTVAAIGRDQGRIGLRTLTLIRWIAVAGQLLTLVVVHFGLGMELPLWPALATVVASAALNLTAIGLKRPGPRLSDRDAALYLAFDTLQLALLLYLTGGLENPFTVMLLAPLTVAATTLSRTSVFALTALVILCGSALALWHQPLNWPGGPLELSPLYALGVWLALLVSAVFIAAYVWSVAHEARRVSTALAATQGALAREQRLSALGALAAAAAHELGTPLGTIAVVAKELVREIPPADPLAEDARLLLSQVSRCRDILAELARKPEADGGEPFERLTVRAMIEVAAAPHRLPTVNLVVTADGAAADVAEPVLARRPEVLHGLGNLLQNAIEFAAARVEVAVGWDARHLTIAIRDDGPGFPVGLIARIGEPYISNRVVRYDPNGGHMGLGIFIAKTLLERSGADVEFANRPDGGAEVVIRWIGPILDSWADRQD
jgi:two-component system, sensor histidine kinase RegB